MSDDIKKEIEQCYPLQKENRLHNLGIQLCTREREVDIDDKKAVITEIYFKKDDREANIELDEFLVPVEKQVLDRSKSDFHTLAKLLSENGIRDSMISSIKKMSASKKSDIDMRTANNILEALHQLDDHTKRIAFRVLRDCYKENLFRESSNFLSEFICEYFDEEDINELDEMGGVDELGDTVIDCILQKNEGVSDEVILKLLPEIKDVVDEIANGNRTYFFEFDDDNHLWMEAIGLADVEEIRRLYDYYDGNWQTDSDEVNDYINEKIEELLSKKIVWFSNTKKFDKWFEKEFKDSYYQPKLDDARKLFMEGKKVAYKKDIGKFIDYDQYREEVYDTFLDDLEERSRYRRYSY